MRIDEGRLPRINRVTALKDSVLRVQFDSGKEYTVDLAAFIRRGKRVTELQDPKLFAQVTRGDGGHSLEWPNGVDFGADTIWELALEQNGQAATVEFVRWRYRHGLSLTAAAEALGFSRRQIAYYASGEHEVPRHVLLALKGWEVEQANAA